MWFICREEKYFVFSCFLLVYYLSITLCLFLSSFIEDFRVRSYLVLCSVYRRRLVEVRLLAFFFYVYRFEIVCFL